MMKLTCSKRCRIMEFLANLKCPNCFGVETSGDEQNECDCRLRIKPELKFKSE